MWMTTSRAATGSPAETTPTLLAAHAQPISQIAQALGTHVTTGLTPTEARARLARDGPNALPESHATPLWRAIVAQLIDPLILLLIGASLIAMLLGEGVDAVAIMAIVVLNAALGVVQEARAARALQALWQLTVPQIQVLRDGQWTEAPAVDLVQGDIVQIQMGDRVPADLRLIDSAQLQIDESALTGESLPVAKHAATVLDQDTVLGDQINSAFMGTGVRQGRGRGIVIATGRRTQLGLIADLMSMTEAQATPLQQRLARLGRVLGVASLSLCAIIFAAGVLRGLELLPMFLTAVSLAIAAVPEGLPAIVTICLALGTQRMLRRHALIRKLPAVETLGSATVICSDKTGTLTQNSMAAVRLVTDDVTIEVSGMGYEPNGTFVREGASIKPVESEAIIRLCRAALLCTDAQLTQIAAENATDTSWQIVGDPTEGALVVLAAKANLWRAVEEAAAPRIAEIPFDAERKQMTTIHRSGERYVAYIKGAPESVSACCARVWRAGIWRPFDAKECAHLLASSESLAQDGLRVLAIATRTLSLLPESLTAATVECDLDLLGLIGIHDSPRPEVRDAIRQAHEAGLRTIMITGDYAATACAIGRSLGLDTRTEAVIDGDTLAALSDTALREAAAQVSIFARVTPQQKLRIVQALRALGEIVAMTGDGVNDAPAFKQADIGIAMGITGTDVAKETADMVLTDDNYVSIVAAIEEGRAIYANIRKFVFYLLSCNVGEIGVLFVAITLGWPVPLRPIHLLWLNLITDGLPALALGLEPGDPNAMRQPPRPPSEPLLDRVMRWGIAVQALVITVATLAAFQIGRAWSDDLTTAQTMAFVTLVGCELLRAFTARSERRSILRIGLLTNRFLLGAVASSLALLLVVVYIPFLDPIFHTAALTGEQWLWLLPWMVLPAVVAELTKALQPVRS